MLRIAAASLATLLVIGSSPLAWADPTPPAPSSDLAKPAKPAAKPVSKDEQMICTTEYDTGSHFNRTRTCMTRRDRDERTAQEQRLMQETEQKVDLGSGQPFGTAIPK